MHHFRKEKSTMVPPALKREADGTAKLTSFFKQIAGKQEKAAAPDESVAKAGDAPGPTLQCGPAVGDPPPSQHTATASVAASKANQAAMEASPPPVVPVAASRSPHASPPPPPPPLPPPSTSSSPDENDYEAARDARVRRNAAMMASLGLADAAAALAAAGGAKQPPKRRAPRVPKARAPFPPDGKRRRSLRSRGGGGGVGDSGVTPAPRSPSPPLIDYDDDTVLRYVMAEGTGVGGATTATIDRVASFRRAPRALAAPTLLRAYSVASRGPLLAAGGKDGVVAVWGVAGGVMEGGGGSDSGDDLSPLAAAKLHRSWVADVALIPTTPCTVPLLLTASNDGAVAAWDLAACAGGGGGRAARVGPPREAGRDDAPHAGSGMFSLDAVADGATVRVATAAKDGSVVLSEVRGDTSTHLLTRLTVIDDAHAGVAKCVRWRRSLPGGGDGDAPIAASAGNDGVLRVWDARTAATTPVATIDAATGAMHVVRWRPGCPHTLLAAGGGPDTPVFDLRGGTSAPSATLRGPPGAGRGSAIYQPTFMGASGDAISIGLPRCSVLSVHDVATGAPRSRGDVGHDVATLAPGPGGALLAVGSRRLHVFGPVGVE